MGIALLIVDMQKKCRAGCRCPEEFDGAVEYINEVSRLFRSKGLPVVVVQDMDNPGGPENEGFDVVPEIERGEDDIAVRKAYCNSFWQTDLEKTLKSRGVKFVVVSGYSAEYCVLFTYNGAVERGFGASLLQKGVAGSQPEDIKRVQLLRPVVSLQALEYILSKQ